MPIVSSLKITNEIGNWLSITALVIIINIINKKNTMERQWHKKWIIPKKFFLLLTII